MERHSAVLYPAVLLGLGAILVLSGVGLASGGSRAPETGIGAAVASVGLVVLLWWSGALALALGAEFLEGRGRAAAASRMAALTPGFMRRLSAVLLGANLLAAPCAASAPAAAQITPAVPAPAVAEPSVAVPPVSLPAVAAPAVTALTVPADRGEDPQLGQSHPSGREPRVSPDWKPLPLPYDPGLLARPPGQQGSAPEADSAGVVVRGGDSLWSIAAARLGPLASDAEIAASWPRWYARNASMIGPDPNLLTPGQTLAAPDPP
ncbi:LysM peptidoglycan-binding domain-containing protein [Arthrobacter sp. MSA 4-2]|uniref:LysM peptidoglycan-binding domain-containing protein n=1 Tax=Arthrobacter sp. MSA 4-2 TaxID=2794349 RepID=UPI0018E7910E|nr:LysM domain-containing protein [Arthrobacter sp. MSA 4-2]MBJ2120990.1 LysM peptidoglycan-binding domain-containing protein [Arthrobacter sp. MSA 4-2]